MKAFSWLLMVAASMAILPALAGGQGNIIGSVRDSIANKPVEDAMINIVGKGGAYFYTTDAGGNFYAGNIPAGTYEIVISFLSNSVKVSNFTLAGDESRELKVHMETSHEIPPVEIVFDRHPLIDPLNPVENFIDRDEFTKAPITKIADYVAMQTGITEIDGELYVRGARAGSVKYVIDGSILMGATNIPICALDNVRTYVGFVPAKFGDTTGGVVAYETRSYFSR